MYPKRIVWIEKAENYLTLPKKLQKCLNDFVQRTTVFNVSDWPITYQMSANFLNSSKRSHTEQITTPKEKSQGQANDLKSFGQVLLRIRTKKRKTFNGVKQCSLPMDVLQSIFPS